MTMKNEYISRRIDACGTVVFSKNDTSKTHLDIAGRFIKDLFTSFIRLCIPSFDNEYGYVQMPTSSRRGSLIPFCCLHSMTFATVM